MATREQDADAAAAAAGPWTYDAFLSYSASDGGAVTSLADLLIADGLHLFFDRQLSAGESWDGLVSGLRESAATIEVIGHGGLGGWGRISLPGLLERAGREDMPVVALL